MSRRLALFVIVTALATGCGKSITGVDLNGKVKLIEVIGSLDNSEGASTILRVRLLLDGQELSNVPYPEATSHIGIVGTRTGDRGHHTLVVVVTDQTSSPVNYRVSGLRVWLVDADLFGGGPTLARADLPDRVELLSSGQGISYDFNL
ncbi:MAG: hypothetical protein ABJC61_15285 [Acidobacteriota bacterium]